MSRMRLQMRTVKIRKLLGTGALRTITVALLSRIRQGMLKASRPLVSPVSAKLSGAIGRSTMKVSARLPCLISSEAETVK